MAAFIRRVGLYFRENITFGAENISLAKTYDSAGKKTKALDLFKQLLAEHPSLGNSASIEARIDLLEGGKITEKELHSTLDKNEKDSNNIDYEFVVVQYWILNEIVYLIC